MIPNIKYVNINIVFSNSEIASGRRCKKAFPINAPAAKATKIRSILFNKCFFIPNVKIPINDTKLINIVARIIYNSIIFIKNKEERFL